jgi:transmembrane sensor
MTERESTPPLSPRSALDWPRGVGLVDPVLQEIHRQVARRRRRRTIALGACALLAAAGAIWQLPPRPGPARSTIVSLPARQTLPDGSIIELNATAEVRVDYSVALRRVELLRGEAHFQVRKDPRRAFVVVAGQVEVRAVGTAFAVQRAVGGVEVLVTEGRVAIDRPEPTAAPALPAAAPLAFVDARSRIVVAISSPPAGENAPAVLSVPAAELAERLAWRVPRLEFSQTPLAEALELFNRHSRVRLVLGDADLGNLHLSGIVRADNTAALLQLLKSDFGLRSEPRGENEIVLQPAK